MLLKKELLQNNMADKNITPKSKSKPLSKKERKEQKKKRKQKHVSYEWVYCHHQQ